MKRILLMTLFILSCSILFSQEKNKIQNGESYKSDILDKIIYEDIRKTVARGDLLTLYIKDMEFAIEGNGEYMLDVFIEFYKGGDLKSPSKTYSYVFKETQKVSKEKTITFEGKYMPIFMNEETDDITHIKLVLKFTKLVPNDVLKFNSLADKYLGVAFESIAIGDVVMDILGFDDATKQSREEFKLEAFCNLPVNFREHTQLKEKGYPVITNEEDHLMTYKGKVKVENNSLIGRLTKFVNAGSQAIANEKLIKKEDYDYVGGYCIFRFSKDFNNQIPKNLEKILNSLIRYSNYGDVEEVSNLIEKAIEKLEEFQQENPNNERIFNNVDFFIHLLKINNQRNKSENDEVGKFDDLVINDFKQWIKRGKWQAPIYNYTTIYEEDTYVFKQKNITNKSILYIPYNLPSEMVMYSLMLQREMHQHMIDFLSKNEDKMHILKYYSK